MLFWVRWWSMHLMRLIFRWRVCTSPVLTKVLYEEAPLILRDHFKVRAHHQTEAGASACLLISFTMISHHVIELSITCTAGQQVTLADGFLNTESDTSIWQGLKALDSLHDPCLHGCCCHGSGRDMMRLVVQRAYIWCRGCGMLLLFLILEEYLLL